METPSSVAARVGVAVSVADPSERRVHRPSPRRLRCRMLCRLAPRIWQGDAPAPAELVAQMNYSTDFYAAVAVEKIEAHAAAAAAAALSSRSSLSPLPPSPSPLFLYVALQNVHSPYDEPPPGECGVWPAFPLCADCVYAQMLHALDLAVDRVASALQTAALWDETLMLFSADNGAVGEYANNRPLRGHKHDPWEGGTRAAAFLAGGALPGRAPRKISCRLLPSGEGRRS